MDMDCYGFRIVTNSNIPYVAAEKIYPTFTQSISAVPDTPNPFHQSMGQN